MKRPRSYGEDLDDAAAAAAASGDNKPAFKDWDRHSSHRRPRDSPRYHRKRYEHDPDRRYRDSDRPAAASPRGSSYVSGGDRLHRSESFSALRREFPKGFRSERPRSRREVSSGSSWRRSSGAGDELRSPSVTSDSGGKGNHGSSEDRGKVRSRDSSLQSKRSEAKKGRKDSSSSSEMEEGELEPDPLPEPVIEAEPASNSKPVDGLDQGNCKDRETEGNTLSGDNLNGKDSGFNVEAACDGKLEGSLPELTVDRRDDQGDKLPDTQNDIVPNVEDEEVIVTLGDNKQETREDTLSMPSRGPTEEQAVKEASIVALSTSYPTSAGKLEEACGEDQCVGAEAGDILKEKAATIDVKLKHKEVRGFDLEAEPEGDSAFFSLYKDGEDDLKVKETHKDKGKNPAVSLSGKAESTEDDNAIEGTSGRGFELAFHSDVALPERGSCGVGVVIGKPKDAKPKLEPLDLSLGLPGIPPDHASKYLNLNHSSPSRARSIQSLPSSFRTISEGFTTSVSFSGSQPFGHNPSCSLTQNSIDNYEHSVGSHPIFQGVEQISNGTIWQAQSSNEPKGKGGGGTLFQRVLLNGNPSTSSLHALKGHYRSEPDGISRQSSLPRQLSPAHSHGSHDTRSENSKNNRLLTRERSSSSLFRSQQQEGELVLNGVGVVERILSKIVTEPLQVTSRMLHEMTEQSIAYLRETVTEMVTNKDKFGQVQALQEALRRRSDLTMETMSRCSRVLLEILVTLKTGLSNFLKIDDTVLSSDLVEIFLDLKCRNLACRSMLPVDDCDCKVCVEKNGFCRECMCLVCSKFDMASNTCSWVGCDLCLHWCHTDCGLRESHIRNGRSASETQGTTEMQFHCIACNHPSELFGFVKEVFKTCSKVWRVETLAKELQYVRRIFSASKDARGKNLCSVADQMLMKLEGEAILSEVINYIMAFLSEGETNSKNAPSTCLPKDRSINAETSNMIACPKKESTWLPSVSAEKVSHTVNMGVLSRTNSDRIGRQVRDAELQVNLQKKPIIDELESLVKFKQAEAKMYQERADDARREAESVNRISVAKNAKIEEECAARIAKLRLSETQERRRQKLEELQIIEKAHHEYLSMKMRMEADIKDLLSKMEATKRNFST